MMVKWSNEEIEILREVYPFGGIKKVSEIKGRSINGVHHFIILANPLLIEDMWGVV